MSGLGLDIALTMSGRRKAQAATAAPVNTSLPVITPSSAVSGTTLGVSNGVWTQPATYTYQWRKATVNIGGATSPAYVVVSGDVGSAIDCVVTATNGFGSASATAASVTPTSSGGSAGQPFGLLLAITKAA